jgi:hypothetical protein
VTHALEPATSGRSKCRGCSRPIARGELRFGERLPNLFGEGEMTLWFHLACAAYKRPEPFLQGFGQAALDVPDRERLEQAARTSLTYRRLTRIDGAERSPSGQATCRGCRELIVRDTWRIRLTFYEEGRFSSGGFIHLACRNAYFEAEPLLDQVLHFSPDLSAEDQEDLRRAYESSQSSK